MSNNDKENEILERCKAALDLSEQILEIQNIFGIRVCDIALGKESYECDNKLFSIDEAKYFLPRLENLIIRKFLAANKLISDCEYISEETLKKINMRHIENVSSNSIVEDIQAMVRLVIEQVSNNRQN